MDKEPITKKGLQDLKSELEKLKNVERPKIVAAIAEARSHGDLKENAEYHAAKEQQAQLESKVIEINDTIARANVIDVTKFENDGKIIFGSTLTVKDLDNEKEIKYKIVGNLESDPSNGYISIDTPIAKAIIGKNEGEIVEVMTPAGKIELEIEQVEHL